MFVYRKGSLKQDPIIISSTEVIYRLTHTSSGMTIEVKFNPLDSTEINPYKVFKEVNGTYTIYKEFSSVKDNKTLKETFEEAIDFFEDKIYEQLKEQKPQVQSPKNSNPPKTKDVTETPSVNDIIKIGNKYGIVTDVFNNKVISRNMTKDEALNVLRARKNANISISKADEDISSNPTFKKGGFLQQKPKIGDVIRVENNYGLVTDIYNTKIEVKNIEKKDALRILKNKNNGTK